MALQFLVRRVLLPGFFSKQHEVFLCCSHLVFSPGFSLDSLRCIHTILLRQTWYGINQKNHFFRFFHNFFNTEISSYPVNCPSLICSWLLIIFLWRFLICLEGFPCRFLKCSFHFKSLSSWLVALSFALLVCFLPLISFSVFYPNHGGLSSTKFQILLIWPWIFSSFVWCVLISSWDFLSFCAMEFFWFLLSNKDAFLMLSRFSFTAIDFQGTLHLAHGLDGIHMAGASIMIFISRSMSFRCPLKNIKFVSYRYCSLISDFTFGKWVQVISY